MCPTRPISIKRTGTLAKVMESFVTIERALEIVRSVPLNREVEQISLDEAHNRILAEDLISKVDDPRFDNSAMDGWAVRSEDEHRTEIGTTAAGDPPTSLGPGEAVRIMTGAPMPEGADAIIMVEDGLQGQARPHFIRRRAENLAEGEVALNKGQIMTPAAISLAATMGYAMIPVQRKLTVTVISTGDELIPPGEELGEGQIHESNSYGLCALLERIGCTAIRHPVVEDSLEGLRDALNGVDCDIILTSGGVSMGEFDFVRKLMESEGDPHFWKVAMRPGKPNACGRIFGIPWFGLPGNPVSSAISFLQYVRPALLRMQSASAVFLPVVDARLSHDVSSREGFLFLLRGVLRFDPAIGGYEVRTTGPQGSGIMSSLSRANSLIVVPEDRSSLAAGEMVRVQLLPQALAGGVRPELRSAP